MGNRKHAYLIMAHNNFMILEILLRLLDDPRNDIYLHINKSVKGFDFDKFKAITKYSTITFVDRIHIRWGAYSHIKCVFSLLKAATQTEHDYYHFLSGVDLPLKSQNYIHDFFDKNNGKEFIHFDKEEMDLGNIKRMKYYHLMQGRPKTKPIRFGLKIINIILLSIEEFLGINRLRKQSLQLQKGADWFSITDALARYVLSQESLIVKMFRLTGLGDEMFIQTIVWNSEFRAKLYHNSFDDDYLACMRYIDWNRGTPYVWRSTDYDDLMNSDFLFARKFDSKIDFKVVEDIFNSIMNNQVAGLVDTERKGDRVI